MSQRVPRWQGALIVSLAVSLLAVTLGAPALFMLAVVPLGYVLVGVASAGPPETLAIERSLDVERPRPGQPVRVTLAVTNHGDRVLPDVRIVDGVPESVPVTSGTPAFATAVRPDETVTHEYELLPPRGEYHFDEPQIRTRNLSSSALDTLELEADGTASLTCETLLDSFSIRDQTIQFVGRAPTDEGGSGIEFYAAREYRHGDPINRIDWHRLARTGELATIEHRVERAVTMVFLVDDRTGVHLDSISGGPDSFDLTMYAASRGLLASLDDGNRTGFAMLEDDTWIDPGAGTDVRRRVDDAVEEASAGSGSGKVLADGGRLAVDLEKRLPRNAQVVFCTPLTDGTAVDLVEQLRLRGRTVTVVSPDMTTGVSETETTPGASVAALERRNRVDAVRSVGSIVVDWDLSEQLSVELVQALRLAANTR
ncbi:DUF58 domain-containing protein [Halobacteria archaeon AArc-curdl1]|uniref:DUF58 domain-containing protein n=1 Tax=Natronosalvus hydrolyticus TaxID=2979988 RepID=A0AAP3E596_9EURY|nr:DUF58 domain-containing protein [Halobacteria archaeon AArc-curdl1]